MDWTTRPKQRENCFEMWSVLKNVEILYKGYTPLCQLLNDAVFCFRYIMAVSAAMDAAFSSSFLQHFRSGCPDGPPGFPIAPDTFGTVS